LQVRLEYPRLASYLAPCRIASKEGRKAGRQEGRKAERQKGRKAGRNVGT